MSQASDFMEDALRTLIFRTGAGYAKGTLAIALTTVAIDDTDTTLVGKEVLQSGGTLYTRVSLAALDANWSAGTGINGLSANVSTITFPTAGASWGTVVGVAICNNATFNAGNVLFYGVISPGRLVNTNDIFTFPALALSVTVG